MRYDERRPGEEVIHVVSAIGLCLKSRNRTWIGSVQGAVATWSVISMRRVLVLSKPVDGYLLLNLLKLRIARRQMSLVLSRECSREAICK